jgi:hypothetical protein
MMLFLSPLNRYLPPWMQNPFSQTPLDIYGSFGAIIIASFSGGFLLYLVRTIITDERGLNDRFFRRIGRKKGTKLEEKWKIIEKLEFTDWLKDRMDWLFTLYMAVSGLIVGGEIAFFANLVFIPFLALYQFLMNTLNLTSFLISSGLYISLSFYPTALFILYNRKFFRPNIYEKELEKFTDAFIEENKKIVASLSNAFVLFCSQNKLSVPPQ